MPDEPTEYIPPWKLTSEGSETSEPEVSQPSIQQVPKRMNSPAIKFVAIIVAVVAIIWIYDYITEIVRFIEFLPVIKEHEDVSSLQSEYVKYGLRLLPGIFILIDAIALWFRSQIAWVVSLLVFGASCLISVITVGGTLVIIQLGGISALENEINTLLVFSFIGLVLSGFVTFLLISSRRSVFPEGVKFSLKEGVVLALVIVLILVYLLFKFLLDKYIWF